MDIQRWLQERSESGTLAHTLRGMALNGMPLSEFEGTARQQYMLEALFRHGGDQEQTAKAIGTTCRTIRRVLEKINLRASDIRSLAKIFGGER